MAKLLYVDHDMKRVIQVQQKLAGFINVEIALNGWEGLAAAMLYSPDLVLVNLMTTVMDGLEMIRLLRTEPDKQNLPVIGFTYPHHLELEKIATQKGCSTIIKFPFSEDLKKIITQNLPLPQTEKTVQISN
ncbi:response regulator [Deltaproteobacteria bacterium TL4]